MYKEDLIILYKSVNNVPFKGLPAIKSCKRPLYGLRKKRPVVASLYSKNFCNAYTYNKEDKNNAIINQC